MTPNFTDAAPHPAAILQILIAGPGAVPFAGALRAREKAVVHAAPQLVEAIILARRHGPIDLFLLNVADESAGLADAITALRSVHPGGAVVALCDPWDEPLCRKWVGRGIDDYLILPCAEAEVAALMRRVVKPGVPAAQSSHSARGKTGMAAHRRDPAENKSLTIAPQSTSVTGRSAAPSMITAPQVEIGLPGITVSAAPPAIKKHSEPDIQIDQNGAERVLVNVELHALHAATAPPPPVLGGTFDEETELERLIEAANRLDTLAPAAALANGSSPIATNAGPSALPLAAHATMLDTVLSVDGSVPGTALQILQASLPWPGTLIFAPADGPPHSAPAALRAVLERDGRRFGTLVLDRANAPAWRKPFEEAAQWLTGWLALAQRQEQLRNLAVTDELSGAYNRRYFIQFVERLIEKARDGRFRITVMLFDIDDFKLYNDQFGHAAGDAIIRELIRLLRHCTRPHDVVARLGGDEFAVVFWDNEAPRQPNSEHPRSVLAATERFRVAVEKCDWNKVSNIAGKVSISGGIASFPWDAKNLDDLLAVADGALLRAKKQGKNVIVLHEPEDGEAPPREKPESRPSNRP